MVNRASRRTLSSAPLFYMGVRTAATTRANTSTSTCTAPARKSAREQASTVAVLEGVDELAGDIVVAHRRARAPVGGRIGDRLHRQHARAGIERERDAEPLAIGRRDEGELRPARRTQPLAADRLAAGSTKL